MTSEFTGIQFIRTQPPLWQKFLPKRRFISVPKEEMGGKPYISKAAFYICLERGAVSKAAFFTAGWRE
ncbi:hypothetical protein D7X48_09955 [bacterium D16-50]|jgi:hypothetical protein|nr:hypothetical protein D7X48_09955 [bacterium D16-50]